MGVPLKGRLPLGAGLALVGLGAELSGNTDTPEVDRLMIVVGTDQRDLVEKGLDFEFTVGHHLEPLEELKGLLRRRAKGGEDQRDDLQRDLFIRRKYSSVALEVSHLLVVAVVEDGFGLPLDVVGHFAGGEVDTKALPVLHQKIQARPVEVGIWCSSRTMAPRRERIDRTRVARMQSCMLVLQIAAVPLQTKM